MFLVIGATGNVGGQLVNELVQQGHNVRALVRDPARAVRLPQEAEIVAGDLEDKDSLTAAVRGTDGVFFVQAEPAVAQAENMVEAARAGNVAKLVVLSSIGPRIQPAPKIAMRIDARDQVFQNSGLDVTYLRPNTLMTQRRAGRRRDRSRPHCAGRSIRPSPGRHARADPRWLCRPQLYSKWPRNAHGTRTGHDAQRGARAPH